MRSAVAAVCLWSAAALLLVAAWRLEPAALVDLPVEEPGLHCLFYRVNGETLDAAMAAVVGSQRIEDEVQAAGGDYHVYWSDDEDVVISPGHRKAVELMGASGESPALCICDAETGRYYLGPCPSSVDEVLAQLDYVMGAQ